MHSARAGLDPAKYAGHSLRAGHATSAVIAGASERSIMNQTRHRSVQMVRRYSRDGSLSERTAQRSWGCRKAPVYIMDAPRLAAIEFRALCVAARG